MNEVYILKDWSALSQVRNSINPDIKVQSSVSPQDNSVCITIKRGEFVLVRIMVDSPDVWSLTSSEAESLLNSYGFNCRYEESYVITPRARKVLKTLHDIGASTIVRFVRPRGEVIASVNNKTSINLKDVHDWCYEDWKFLTPELPYSITNLLKG